mmetsp:Transcript_51323/g.111621  ORF Transcript_51323/g.111621 Transcript_51323/m.111621 type:complete len:231 (+) Transcript_51323:361-1053(+)
MRGGVYCGALRGGRLAGGALPRAALPRIAPCCRPDRRERSVHGLANWPRPRLRAELLGQVRGGDGLVPAEDEVDGHVGVEPRLEQVARRILDDRVEGAARRLVHKHQLHACTARRAHLVRQLVPHHAGEGVLTQKEHHDVGCRRNRTWRVQVRDARLSRLTAVCWVDIARFVYDSSRGQAQQLGGKSRGAMLWYRRRRILKHRDRVSRFLSFLVSRSRHQCLPLRLNDHS